MNHKKIEKAKKILLDLTVNEFIYVIGMIGFSVDRIKLKPKKDRMTIFWEKYCQGGYGED